MAASHKSSDPQQSKRTGVVAQLGETDRKLAAVLRLTQPASHKQGVFRSLAHGASTAVGRPWAFATALAIVMVWAALGPLFHYSDTWQLVINTGTTIITFLMVFLIQSAQNRDTDALRLKLDALILGIHSASNAFVEIEDYDDAELEQVRQKLRSLASSPSGTPDV
jgi:low affinity Fe/Cu permease